MGWFHFMMPITLPKGAGLSESRMTEAVSNSGNGLPFSKRVLCSILPAT